MSSPTQRERSGPWVPLGRALILFPMNGTGRVLRFPRERARPDSGPAVAGNLALASDEPIYEQRGSTSAPKSVGIGESNLWDDLNPTGFPQVLVEYSGATPAAATPSRTHAFGHGHISQREVASGQTSFFIGDGIGTTRLLTDEGGHEAATFTYDAFGNILAHTGTRTTDHLFAGEHFDADVDLVYLRARWYDPAGGRLRGRDPVFFDRLGRENAFLYVDHDPLNRVDPTGEFSLVELTVEAGLQGKLESLRANQAAAGAATLRFVQGVVSLQSARALVAAAVATKVAIDLYKISKRLYLHYSYLDQVGSLLTGLFPGTYVTRDIYFNGNTAWQRLAIPHPRPVDAVYITIINEGLPVTGSTQVLRTLVPPRDGGGTQYRLPAGSGGPGTVLPPIELLE